VTDFRALCTELVVALGRAAAGLNSGTAHAGDRAAWAHEAFQTAARAESALAQPAPPAEGEVGELVNRLRRASDGASAMGWEQDAWTIARAAELLQQRHPEPVPVRERLPGPEDCTTNPRNGRGQWCWGWVQHDQPPYSGRWRMMLREWLSDEAVAWLPATALPLPSSTSPNKAND
jgi:hypothetical protein